MISRLCAGFALALAGSAASAAPLPALLMDDAGLAAQRGGLATPFGIDIGFGATVRTSVDGKIALATQLTWTPNGAVTRVIGGDGRFDPTNGSFTALLPSASGGSTKVSQTLEANRITGLVVNTASGRTVRQDTDITLTLPQLPALQQQIAADRIAATVQNAVSLALRSGR